MNGLMPVGPATSASRMAPSDYGRHCGSSVKRSSSTLVPTRNTQSSPRVSRVASSVLIPRTATPRALRKRSSTNARLPRPDGSSPTIGFLEAHVGVRQQAELEPEPQRNRHLSFGRYSHRPEIILPSVTRCVAGLEAESGHRDSPGDPVRLVGLSGEVVDHGPRPGPHRRILDRGDPVPCCPAPSRRQRSIRCRFPRDPRGVSHFRRICCIRSRSAFCGPTACWVRWNYRPGVGPTVASRYSRTLFQQERPRPPEDEWRDRL